MGYSIQGWASTTSIICFIGGVQLISLGVIGEYIGKIYLETKGDQDISSAKERMMYWKRQTC